ncbi:hypothetical protein [Streptomyces sp. NBC_01614]
MPTDRSQQLVLVLVATALVGRIALTYPSVIPVSRPCSSLWHPC